MEAISVKKNQPLKGKPRMGSHFLDWGSRGRECVKYANQTELLVIPQGQTRPEDHRVSAQKKGVKEANPSPLGISAYQTKFREEQLKTIWSKMSSLKTGWIKPAQMNDYKCAKVN